VDGRRWEEVEEGGCLVGESEEEKVQLRGVIRIKKEKYHNG